MSLGSNGKWYELRGDILSMYDIDSFMDMEHHFHQETVCGYKIYAGIKYESYYDEKYHKTCTKSITQKAKIISWRVVSKDEATLPINEPHKMKDGMYKLHEFHSTDTLWEYILEEPVMDTIFNVKHPIDAKAEHLIRTYDDVKEITWSEDMTDGVKITFNNGTMLHLKH